MNRKLWTVVAVAAIAASASIGVSSADAGETNTQSLNQPEYLVASPVLTQKAVESVNAETAARVKAEADAAAAQAAAAAAAQAAEESARRARDSAQRRTTSSVSSTTSQRPQFDDAAFDRVAQCETGGNWSHQTAFDGGLGIAHGNWVDLRTGNGYAQAWPELPEWGSQASRELQIAAARRFIERYGIHGWGCWRAFIG